MYLICTLRLWKNDTVIAEFEALYRYVDVYAYVCICTYIHAGLSAQVAQTTEVYVQV